MFKHFPCSVCSLCSSKALHKCRMVMTQTVVHYASFVTGCHLLEKLSQGEVQEFPATKIKT